MRGRVKKFGLEELRNRIEALTEEDRDAFFKEAANTLGNAVMGKARELTPVGDYSDRLPPYNNVVGGTLRDSWKMTPVVKHRNGYLVQVQNPIEYASYVNYGHRQNVGQFIPPYGKRAKKPFIKGQYMLERAEMQTNPQAKLLLTPILNKYLKKVFEDGK